MSEIKANEVNEVNNPAVENFKKIQPENGMTTADAKEFWNQEFSSNGEGDKQIESTEPSWNDELENSSEPKVDEEKQLEKGEPIKNKQDGCERERIVSEELHEKYPSEDGYDVVDEVYLRDADGKIVKDPESGEARRVDFMVVKDEKVVDSIEVTSLTAPKKEQTDKETRIRGAGGNYIYDNNRNLVEIPADVKTLIERRK